MALVKTNGSLYFLRDKDYLTGEMGRYVKIGIVRKDKTTEKRIQEHQTGNPRDIIDVYTISGIPFVEKLETLIHYRFIEKWITGEWFDLDDNELKLVISEAKRMKAEQIKNEFFILKVEKLVTNESNGIERKATKTEKKLRDEYLIKLKRKKELEAHLALIRSGFCKELGTKFGEITGIMDMSYTSDTLTFDTKSIKANYFSLYETYCKSEINESIKQKFDINGEADAALSKWNIPLDNKKKNIPVELFSPAQVNKAKKRSKKTELLHANYLMCLKEKYLLEWDLELIEFQLKASVGIYEKIEGVCSWKRELKKSESYKFDEDKLKKDQPALYLAHLMVKKGHHKINIYPHRAYKPS
jgi:hypothetical protein